MARAKSTKAPTPPTPPAEAPAPAMPWAAPGSLNRQAGRGYMPGERAHYLYHMPGHYMALGGYCVPALLPLFAGEAGVNGVDAVRSRDGKSWVADPEPAIVRITRRGGTVIPHNVDAELGHASYLVPVPGTRTFAHRLQELVPGMPPQGADVDAMAAWLRSLMERGIVATPHAAEVKAVGVRLRTLAEANASTPGAAAKAIQANYDLYAERALVEQVA